MAEEFLLPVILAVAGLGGAVLAAVSIAALVRRRSMPYVLVALALVTLVVRTLVGSVMLGGLMTAHVHHLVEHLLDVLVVGLLFTAVYTARQPGRDRPTDLRYRDYDD